MLSTILGAVSRIDNKLFPAMGMHMRWFTALTLLIGFTVSATAHHPDRENAPVRQRIDLIGPIGSQLPMSHRREYNRPSNWSGKIAYWIAPSSQEAMAWHDATHRGLYENDRPRVEKHFFYPKPWESLRLGARELTVDRGNDSAGGDSTDPVPYGSPQAASQLQPIVVEPMTADPGLIEQ